MIVRVRQAEEGRIGPEERLVVMRPAGESRIDYALTNAGAEVPLAEVVRAQRQRHRIEEVFGAGKGEVGVRPLRGAELGGMAPPVLTPVW